MLTVQEFVHKTKKNSTDYFHYMLEILIDNQITYVREEDSLFKDIDPHLFYELEKNIKKIKTKQSFFMRFLSMLIPIEDNKKTQRKQLTILFDKVNLNIYKLNQALSQNKKVTTSLSNTLDYLQVLKNEFLKDTHLSKDTFYVKEIDAKIFLLKGFTLTLGFQEVNLLELKKVYQTLTTKV